MREWIESQTEDLSALVARLRRDGAAMEAIEKICAVVVDTLRGGGKLLTLGNGGSAADALHLAEELIGRYRGDRPPLPALCLSADGTALTCIANDYGFDAVFSRQVEALARRGDALVVFSTSGRSANVVEALHAARQRGAITIGLLGRDGGEAAPLCDYRVVVPHDDTARIQEIHGLLLHLICEAVERSFLPA